MIKVTISCPNCNHVMTQYKDIRDESERPPINTDTCRCFSCGEMVKPSVKEENATDERVRSI
jgi:uncharacterized Zn finger protein